MSEYVPQPLADIAEQLAKLPGVGMKTAQRLSYHLLGLPIDDVKDFTESIMSARLSVTTCAHCQNFAESDCCAICADSRRNAAQICVVESPREVTAIERSGGFFGVYHVLHGLLSPMDGVGPEQLRIRELMARLPDAEEVVMATSPTVEGEATAAYLSRLVKAVGVKTTRLAYGLPAGGSIEFADTITLARAIENRGEM